MLMTVVLLVHALVPRYELVVPAVDTDFVRVGLVVHRLDRWTGRVKTSGTAAGFKKTGTSSARSNSDWDTTDRSYPTLVQPARSLWPLSRYTEPTSNGHASHPGA